LTLLLIGAVLLPVAVAARVIQVSQRDDRAAVDAIVVLGAAATNGTPGRVLEARLEHALDLYAAGVAPVVVTAGGTGQGQSTSEGEVGREWLVARGVPADAVVAVGVGGNTITSLEAVEQERRRRGWGSVLLVSDPWHLYRTRAMAEDVGLPVAGTSPVSNGPNVERGDRIVFNVVRETAAFLVYRAETLATSLGDAVDGAVTSR
jgi:uncharacterized SAM-binding protein YcdF (DUF218 family)